MAGLGLISLMLSIARFPPDSSQPLEFPNVLVHIPLPAIRGTMREMEVKVPH